MTIKINGGAYKWVDTKDGYKTILDVPLVAEFAKGTKGIEYAGDRSALEDFVTRAQKRYREGNFCATAYKRHNPDIPLDHPDFAGFALPTRVGMAKTEQGEKLATFGNLKISDSKFEEAKAGKLPYLSPEISRFEKKIRGVAFLDTLPPHNEFPLFTIGEEVKDSAAAFAATPDTANFADPEPTKKDFSKDYPEAHEMLKGISESVAKLAASNGRIGADPLLQKPDPKPAEPKEPKEAKMSMDPEFAAKFAAQANDLAEIKAKFAAQERGEKVKALVAKADAALSRKIIDKGVRDSVIAKFASDAVDMKDGEKWFDATVEALKPSLKDKPPTLGDAATFDAGSESADPVVAKLSKDGNDPNEVAKFAAQFDALKRTPNGRFFSFTKEDYIKSEMGLAKARANGAFSENRG